MDELSREDVDRLRRSQDRLIEVMEKRHGSQIGNSNIYVNAGGIGILIVTGLAAFIAGICIAMGVMVIHQQKQIDDLHDYLNVVYQYAPQLKPKEFK